ncbi:MAG: ATP-binding cassette domain-containing protein [Erysipelotrichaceae bacterium]
MSIVVMETLSKTYGKTHALSALTLQIEQGEAFALVGPAGCGKTTLLHLLLNVVQPTKGNVSIFDKNVTTFSKTLKADIGFVPAQNGLSPHDSLQTHLKKVAALRGKRDLEEEERLCARFSLDVTQKLGRYSAEQQKLAALVIALAHAPQLLLLDNPFAPMEASTQAKVIELLKEKQQKGMTLIVSTREIDSIQDWCQRVAFLHAGNLISVTDLKKTVLKGKRITITYRNTIDLDQFHLEYEKLAPNRVQFIFPYHLNHLPKWLAVFDLEDLEIQSYEFKDRFQDYYKGA